MKLRPVTIPSCNHLGLRAPAWQGGPLPYLMTSEGFALRNRWILQSLNISSLVVVSKTAVQCPLPEPHWAITQGRGDALGLVSSDYFARSYLSTYPSDREDFLPGEFSNARVHVPAEVSARWPNNAVGKTLLGSLERRSGASGTQVFTTQGFKPFGFPFKAPEGKRWAIAECSLRNISPPDPKASAIGKAFMDLLGTCLIPYDLSERRARFGQAFHELKDYIDRREELAKKKPRRGDSP
jgi:hypothetical protein